MPDGCPCTPGVPQLQPWLLPWLWGAWGLPAPWQQDVSLSLWARSWAGEDASNHWVDIQGCQVVPVGLRHFLPPQGSLEVSLSQPTRSSSGSER